MSAKKLAEHFSELKDPRCSGKVEHLPIDILVIAVCAVIAGAESWVDMALYGQNKADWLSTFLRLPNGIPAHDTFRRVFMLIDPEDFESRFTAWTQAFPVSGNREVVAIDGKMVRGSFDRSRDQGPLHIVSAWASERGLVLGQRQVGDESNEITAVPELLDTLDLKGSIVTLDAMGCQKAIVSKILENGAPIIWSRSRPIGARSLPRCEIIVWKPVLHLAHPTGRPRTSSMTNMDAWSAAESSPVRRPLGSSRCATGPDCGPPSQRKASAASTVGQGRGRNLPCCERLPSTSSDDITAQGTACAHDEK